VGLDNLQVGSQTRLSASIPEPAALQRFASNSAGFGIPHAGANYFSLWYLACIIGSEINNLGSSYTRVVRLADQFIGIFTDLFFAKSLASIYPASTWRMMPMPGSVVKTRSMRLAMASVPSATVTCPA
jgi:hypothetical protein